MPETPVTDVTKASPAAITVSPQVTPISLLPDALLLGAMTAMGYAVTHAYEAGMCEVLHVPKELIVVSPNSVLDAVGMVFTMAMIGHWCVNLALSMDFKPQFASVRWRLLYTIPATTFGGLVFLLLRPRPEATIAVAIVLAALALNWGVPALAGPGSYLTRLARFDDRAAARKPTPLEAARLRLRLRDRLFLAFAPTALMVVYCSGEWSAATKANFTIIADGAGLVVLRTYGDKMIVAPFNRAKKTVSTRVRLVAMSELAGKTLVDERVGPLASESPSEEELDRERREGQIH